MKPRYTRNQHHQIRALEVAVKKRLPEHDQVIAFRFKFTRAYYEGWLPLEPR